MALTLFASPTDQQAAADAAQALAMAQAAAKTIGTLQQFAQRTSHSWRSTLCAECEVGCAGVSSRTCRSRGTSRASRSGRPGWSGGSSRTSRASDTPAVPVAPLVPATPAGPCGPTAPAGPTGPGVVWMAFISSCNCWWIASAAAAVDPYIQRYRHGAPVAHHAERHVQRAARTLSGRQPHRRDPCRHREDHHRSHHQGHQRGSGHCSRHPHRGGVLMADINIPAGAIGSPVITLTPNTVQAVVFVEDLASVEVISDGAAPVWWTCDGTTPAVGVGWYLPTVGVDERQPNVAAGTTVKLISTGAAGVRVQRSQA